MKRLLRILTILLLLIAMPIILAAFFPKLASWAETQPWAPDLYMFLIGTGIFALFVGLDLLNRVEVYKGYVAAGPDNEDNFWEKNFAIKRLGFMRSAILVTLLLAIGLVFIIFNLMIIPKVPDGNWYLWIIKILGMGIGIGILFLLNAVLLLQQGKKVILGIDAKPNPAKREKTWQDILFQIKPTFMDSEVDLKEDFDGITELDNPPPPWFMWLFYGTIVFAGIYLVRFTWTSYGPTQEQEFALANGEIKTAQKKSAGDVDESNVTLETDKTKIAEAGELFLKKCAICHGEQGEGKNGPNLTDEYWIHGGDVKSIFKTIKYGVLEKGMIAWGDQIPPLQMKAVTAYILSLQGTKPANAKDPEGTKMGAEAAPAVDSTGAAKP